MLIVHEANSVKTFKFIFYNINYFLAVDLSSEDMDSQDQVNTITEKLARKRLVVSVEQLQWTATLLKLC